MRESHIKRVPILENAVFVGMEIDGDDEMLLFRRDDYIGHICVYISARKGGRLWFSYKQWDDRLGGVEITYAGPHGDPSLDDPLFDDDEVDGV